MSISNRPFSAPVSSVGAAAGAGAVRRDASVNMLEYLTPGDFELVYQATGKRITKDSELVPVFAGAIASARSFGSIPQGQPVSADWLRSMATAHRSSDAAAGGMAEQFDLALQYLVNGRVPGRQVSL